MHEQHGERHIVRLQNWQAVFKLRVEACTGRVEQLAHAAGASTGERNGAAHRRRDGDHRALRHNEEDFAFFHLLGRTNTHLARRLLEADACVHKKSLVGMTI